MTQAPSRGSLYMTHASFVIWVMGQVAWPIVYSTAYTAEGKHCQNSSIEQSKASYMTAENVYR
jgi:hypothetical protein